MYATVTRDGTGRIVVYGPYGIAVTASNDQAVTVAICPPGAADRTTGTLAHPYQHATAGPALTTAPVCAPATASVGDLNAPTVAVCIHPRSHSVFVVGPFTGPDRAEQWWHTRTNRFAETGAHCHVLALTAPSTGDATPSSGDEA
ncbi:MULTISPECIES: hypothetical protein [Salinispora]|uniref:hypothetical protein n=1 Tax=Salinispora TaxID=168694 RepID=UPI000379D14A|nr:MULTISPECIES: hypothetical protein [Salinispora]